MVYNKGQPAPIQGGNEELGISISHLTPEGLERLERQLIAVLNTVRFLLGKRAVIVPGDNRAKAAHS